MNENVLLGSTLTLISALSYAILTALVKTLGAHTSIPTIVFIQSSTTLVIIVVLMLFRGTAFFKKTIRSDHKTLHLARNVFSVGISYLLFTAVLYMPLVNAVLLLNMSPILIPFLGYLLLKNKFNHALWLPILLGFIGVILVLQPHASSFNAASFFAIGAAACMAMSILLARKTSSYDSSWTIAFYYFFYSTIISAIIVCTFWTPITFHELLILIITGVLFFVVQFALSYAVQHIAAELVSSLYYSNVVFAAIIGVLIWHHIPNALAITGIILTCLGGIWCIRVQSRQAKAKKDRLI